MKQINSQTDPRPVQVVVLGVVVMPTALATPTVRSAIASAAVAKPHGQTTLNTLRRRSCPQQAHRLPWNTDASPTAKPVGLAGGSLAGSYPTPGI